MGVIPVIAWWIYICNQSVVRFIPACAEEEYSIQLYMIKFVSVLQQVGVVLRDLRFSPPINTSDLVSDYCLTPNEEFVIRIMARTSYNSMK